MGFISTTANLPAAASGQAIQLRWRMGTDNSTAGTGWRIDTIRLAGDGDYGDAPLPYPVTFAENGASHLALGPTLGATRDVEANGVHSANADSDGADEDGVTFGTIEAGGANEDILIAGRTTSDTNVANLNTLRTEWISANSYATRITNLRAGVGSPVVSLKRTINVLNDAGEDDSLTGGIGIDWYFRALDDVITDLFAGETIDLL